MVKYVVALTFSNDKVLLIRKLKPEWQKGKLNGIGGKIEGKEYPVEAIRREFREETGVDISEYYWELFCVLNGSNVRIFFFRTDQDVSEARTIEKEKIEWVKFNPLPKDVIENLKWLIPMAYSKEKVYASVDF